jgi:hypothetical protein
VLIKVFVEQLTSNVYALVVQQGLITLAEANALAEMRQDAGSPGRPRLNRRRERERTLTK